LIEKIVDYLKKSFEAEQEFYKQTHENLRKELDQVQNRISRLVDSHLDGKIDGDIYEQKLNECDISLAWTKNGKFSICYFRTWK
jgi:hypothetical protein